MPALHPVWIQYATLIGGVLVAAGLVLALLSRGLGKDVSGPWATYRGWCLMVPAVLVTLALGRATAAVGVMLLSIFAFKEFARATGLYRDWGYTIAVYLGCAGLCALVLMPDPRTGAPGWYGGYMASPVYAIAFLLSLPILRNSARGQLQSVALSVIGFVYLGWMFGHYAWFANTEHFYGYALFLVFAVEACDIAAFTCGKLFGRRKLRSEISPNKTVGGSLGAFGLAMALPWLLRFSFPHFGTAELLLSGLIVGIGGQLGDLTISFIKRDIGIKDMGVAIPGHGGVLDRIDSLVFVAPLFFHMTRWFHAT